MITSSAAMQQTTSLATAAGEIQNQIIRKPLNESIKEAMTRYFAQLGGGQVSMNLYDMVLDEIEAPVLEAVMIYTKGNQSKAARMLGLSRGTLRTKLRKYFDDRKPGKERAGS